MNRDEEPADRTNEYESVLHDAQPIPASPKESDDAAGSLYRACHRFRFSAAHSIPGLEPGTPTGRHHGHTFVAEFMFEADGLLYPGVVVDDTTITAIRAYIDSTLDHRDLNTVLASPPTCEALAEHLARWFLDHTSGTTRASITGVRVSTEEKSADFHVTRRLRNRAVNDSEERARA